MSVPKSMMTASLEMLAKALERQEPHVKARVAMANLTVPYPEFCVHPHKCAGKASCQRKPFACAE